MRTVGGTAQKAVKAEKGLLGEIVKRIRDAMDPDKVILFGSRARGTARPNSDFDILVIKRSHEPRHQRARRLYTILADLPAEIEVVVYTPAEVKEWSKVSDAFVTTAVREGRVLYEREG